MPLIRKPKVAMNLLRPGKPPLELKAVVVSTRWAHEGEPYDMAGVQFEMLTDVTRAELKDFLAKLVAGAH